MYGRKLVSYYFFHNCFSYYKKKIYNKAVFDTKTKSLD